jgi:phosphoglycerate dehydrogenase-like enzyme
LNTEVSNKHMEIVIPDDYPPVFADSAALARLNRLPDIKVESYTNRPQNSGELIERMSGAHTIILARSNTLLTNSVLESTSPVLKHIALLGTATDHVSLEATRRLGVIVTNTPNSSTVAVAEHALALLFSLARKIPQLDQRVRIGEWPGGQLTQLAGKTLGIVGTGSVGIRLAQIASGIGMRILVNSVSESVKESEKPNWTEVSFSELLTNSDAISVHARLTPETRMMFRASEFSKMKPTALFINTARGDLVDTGALAEALANETIAGAALDVFNREPLNPQSILNQLPNLILTPHIASNTNEALIVSLNMVIDNVINFINGDNVPNLTLDHRNGGSIS